MNTPPINLQSILTPSNGPIKFNPAPGGEHQESFPAVQQAVEYANQTTSQENGGRAEENPLTNENPSQLPKELKQLLTKLTDNGNDDELKADDALPALLEKNTAVLDDTALDDTVLDDTVLDDTVLDDTVLDDTALDNLFALVDNSSLPKEASQLNGFFSSGAPFSDLAAAGRPGNDSDRKENPAANLISPKISADSGIEIPISGKQNIDTVPPDFAEALTKRPGQQQTAPAPQAEVNNLSKANAPAPAAVLHRLQATAETQSTADFESLVAKAFGQADESTVTGNQNAGKNNGGIPKAAKTENTVSLTMGEQFKEVIGLRDAKTAVPVLSDTSLRQPTINQETVAAQSGQTGEGRVILESGDQLLSESDQDEAGLQTALARSEQGGPATKADGQKNIFEPLLAETGNTGHSRQATATTGEAGTVRLPSGTMVAESQVVNHVVEKISLNIRPRHESSSITIKMHPEELGELKLRLEITNDSVKAQFLAQTQQSQEILEKHIYRLREALENQGLKLDDIEVAVDSGRKEHGNQLFNEQWAQSSQRGPGSNQSRAANPDQNDHPDHMATASEGLHDPTNGRVSLRV